ncbi:Fic family protein [Candidatus Poriferisocius sp.]|uniref:Fic family protein n=1 Tax=Candidatus Poriferisocius sp. TaxID=3101276 RepID=UPI003B5C9F82
MSRRDRRGCSYDAYLADSLAGWNLLIPGDVAADVADAEAAIRALNAAGTAHVSLEGLARFLLRAESVGSSKIEGLEAAARRLARAEAAMALGGDANDRVAVEVIGNIVAMESAVELATSADPFGLDDLLSVHRTLMDNSPTPEVGGVVREEQNWIGGSSFNPCSAAFVPPPPEYLDDLLSDLLGYVNDDEHSPLVQAAVAHAQFETLHPFSDGNGRTGRALIHVVLRRRGLAPTFVPPISLVLATWSDDYVNGLMTYRHLGEPDSAERSASTVEWLRFFAAATSRACRDAESYSMDIGNLTAAWRSKLGGVRANSSTDLLLRVLPGVPIITVESAARLIGRSKARTTDAVNALAEARVLRQRNVGKQRYRVFEATDVIDLFTTLERTLATPTGDTSNSQPIRMVPDRPPR